MPYKRLNRDGRESFRNLAKPYRPQREVLNKKTGKYEIHPMDNMMLGPTDRHINTTGCFGNVSTFGMGRFSILKRTGLPGKSSSSRKRKNGSKLIPGNKNTGRWQMELSFPQLVELRADLLFCKAVGEFAQRPILSNEALNFFHELTRYLLSTFPERKENIVGKDADRIASARGMYKTGKVKFMAPKSINQRLARAKWNMGLKKRDNIKTG